MLRRGRGLRSRIFAERMKMPAGRVLSAGGLILYNIDVEIGKFAVFDGNKWVSDNA